ncbi:sugar transferase [Clostridium gasigenes]|uniref:Sugar transferase n=1 Tax=Clostridium gasigenes TaxID=94869 RepID=A0A7X0VPR5_9CLOT|nr:sugar transferase [Clostridium gasigenes]MBB6713534.1 sugar transferase [Clostridium gasigenes]
MISNRDLLKVGFSKDDEKYLYKVCKRIFDIIASLIGIIVLLPIFLILIILVKLDSKGPVFFSHNRLGKDADIIKIYKFRSMVVDAKEVFDNFTDAQKEEFRINFKLDNDPRITKVGHILRKTSLDELPQLLNILIGNMSVVGPRPIIEEEVEKYGIYSKKLFTVKAGLTGFWQANGRSETTYEERVDMDMYYIDNMSIWLDIKIIFQTVLSVLQGKGAV